MTKADIIEQIYGQVGLSKKESGEVVELVLEAIKAGLERGEKVKISGFGNFVVREKSARKGRNPQTKDAIEIAARRILSFRPSQLLKAAINDSALAPAPPPPVPLEAAPSPEVEAVEPEATAEPAKAGSAQSFP